MSVEKPREFVKVKTARDGSLELRCATWQVQTFHRGFDVEAEIRANAANGAIERRLVEMGIGQDILSHPFQCIMCHRETIEAAYYIDLNGPLCKECKEKGHVGHPATPPPQPQEPSVTLADVLYALAVAREVVKGQARELSVTGDRLVGVATVENAMIAVLDEKGKEKP